MNTNHPILQKNIGALAPHAPRIAELLSPSFPEGWTPAIGTDGTATLQRLHADHMEWLGNTSMPAASAIPLTAAMVPGNANALGLGIGTGFEWQHLLTRLQPQQALFVLETDPAAAALALSICDLSPALAAAKLILLLGPDADAQLAAWLAQYPGLEPPSVMHPLPTLSIAARHALLSLGEAMIRASIVTRSEQMESAARALQQITPDPDSILAMLLTPRRLWAQPVALASYQCSLRLDHHLTGGRFARLNLCLQQKPGTIITEVFRHQLQIPLPPQISVHTHIPPVPNLAFWQPEYLDPAKPLAPTDRLIVHSTSQKDLLTKSGFPASQIQIIPVRSCAAEVRGSAGAAVASPGPASVTLVADLPSTDPATYGLTLPSHVALWQAAMDLITEDPLSIHWDLTADIFRRAQQRASVQVTDATLAASLHSGIRHVLMEALLPITLARQLHAAQIPLTLIGQGWEPSKITSNVTFLPFPPLNAAANQLPASPFPANCVYLHISPSGTVPPALLHAIALGVPIAAATHPLDTRPGGICTLLQEGTDFLRLARQSWLPQLRALLADAPRRQRLAQSAPKKLNL